MKQEKHIVQACPDFVLKKLGKEENFVTLSDLKGHPFVLHVWASWCGACLQEHNEWIKIKQRFPVTIVAVLYRDEGSVALEMLKEKGDPYSCVLEDKAGRLGLDLGLMGTPETFLIDKEGDIRYHRVGVLTASIFEKEVAPLL